MSCCCWPKNSYQDHGIQSKSPITKFIHKIKKHLSPIPIQKKNAKYPKNCSHCNSVYYNDNTEYCCGECKFSTMYGSFNSENSDNSLQKSFFSGYNSS